MVTGLASRKGGEKKINKGKNYYKNLLGVCQQRTVPVTLKAFAN